MLLLLDAGCRRGDDLDVARRRTEALAPALVRIAAHRVAYVRDQSWCRGIAYDRGHFSDSDHPSTCALAPSVPLPLDPRANVDLTAFVADLESSGVELQYATFDYDPTGRLARAEVALDQRSFLGPSVSWVWAPTDPPTSMGGESRVVPIAGDWYLVTTELL